jgi:hypothetical protein
MVPVKRLFDKTNRFKAVKDPSDDGMVPVNWLALILISVNLVNNPSVDGMVPVNPSSNNKPSKSKCTKVVSNANSSGIGPVSPSGTSLVTSPLAQPINDQEHSFSEVSQSRNDSLFW